MPAQTMNDIRTIRPDSGSAVQQDAARQHSRLVRERATCTSMVPRACLRRWKRWYSAATRMRSVTAGWSPRAGSVYRLSWKMGSPYTGLGPTGTIRLGLPR